MSVDRRLLKAVGTMFTQEYSANVREGDTTKFRDSLINPLRQDWAAYIGALHVQMGTFTSMGRVITGVIDE